MTIGRLDEKRRMCFNRKTCLVVALIICCLTIEPIAKANNHDPCGMVPPIYTGDVPISRVGLQKTYVFYKDGIETFVIRPGFSGNVDNFGMLIPFPSPPSLRKVPDEIFSHVEAAIDPPEVVVHVGFAAIEADLDSARTGSVNELTVDMSIDDRVTILKQEAVGMYEVAVLEAGSAKALKKWMDDHGYQYPDGMDKVCDEYIEQKWCFVAVKTRVGTKEDSDPKPGQRDIDNRMPNGSSFDGFVQGMGFRFKTDELVVPMRLSAFNEGDLRNVVYLLTDSPQRIRSIPEEFVVRQIDGELLHSHVTQPLPLRIIGGTYEDIPEARRRQLKIERDPYPKNGLAKELFSTDLLSVSSGEMSLQHEEDEKELLRIGEHFGLRGPDIDNENAEALKQSRDRAVAGGLDLIKDMTLTVVDGDFPREVIAEENLTFASFRMPAGRNNSNVYDAKLHGPAPERDGILIASYGPGSTGVLAGRMPFWIVAGITLGLVSILLASGWLLSRAKLKPEQ